MTTEAAFITAVVTVVGIVTTWACRRLGKFGQQVLKHLGTFAGLPAAVHKLGDEVRAAVQEFRTHQEDLAARVGRLEQHTGVIP